MNTDVLASLMKTDHECDNHGTPGQFYGFFFGSLLGIERSRFRAVALETSPTSHMPVGEVAVCADYK
jgi:hypothetical protein